MKPWVIRFGFLAVFLVAFRTLLPGVAPHITAGDAGELALAGATLGIPHPPGYPVFALVQRALGTLAPFGNAAFRQNVGSALLISTALLLLSVLILRLTGQRWTLGLPILLLTAPLLRRAGQTAEVFPLTFLWATVLLLGVFLFSKRPAGGVLLGFLFGIAVAVHHTLLLMLPAVAFFFFRQQGEPWKTARKLWLPALAGFAAGLTIFFYLPLRSMADPALDWEDPETLRRFWDVVTRARYGFLRLAQGSSAPALSLGALGDAMAHARRFHIENLGWTGAILVAFGSLHSLARRYHRRLMVTCWLHIFFTGPFFFWMAGVPFGKAGVLSRFGLLPLVGGGVLIALGLSPLWSSGIRLYRGFMVALLAAFFIEAGIRKSPEGAAGESMRWDQSVRECGLNTIRTVPAQAVLFADRADETEFALAYLLNGEGRRSDIRFIDCNAGVSRSIYGDDYYRVWGPPRLAERERVEGAIVNSSKLPVFYATLDPAMVDIYRTPRGLVYRAWPLMVPPKASPVAWHRLLAWRSEPAEPRSTALYHTDLDLIARDLFETKQMDGALAVFGLSQRLGGPNRWEQVAYWFQVRGELNRAREAYEKADAAGDESAAFFSNYGALMADLDRIVPAIEIYQRGLSVHPKSVKILYNLAVARWETGSTDEAKRLAARVLELEPWHVEAQRLLVQKSEGNRI